MVNETIASVEEDSNASDLPDVLSGQTDILKTKVYQHLFNRWRRAGKLRADCFNVGFVSRKRHAVKLMRCHFSNHAQKRYWNVRIDRTVTPRELVSGVPGF